MTRSNISESSVANLLQSLNTIEIFSTDGK